MARTKHDSLPERLDMRVLCTGEPANVARRQLLAEGGPLIPAAVDGQHQLEAAFLPVIRAAGGMLARDRPAGWGGAVVRQARLRTDSLSLALTDEAVHHVLAASLPTATPIGLTGIPGLRPELGQGYLDLNVVGADGHRTGHVRLLGVTSARWRAIREDFVEHTRRAHEPVWLRRDGDLHVEERRSLDNVVGAPTDLMSAVLRRYPLWRHSAWVDSAIDGRSLRLRWEQGLPHEVVVAILTESLCRIPGVTAVPEQLSDKMRSILLSYAEIAARTSPDDAWAWVELRALDLAASAELDSADFVVAPEVWNRQEMRDALARRELSSVYRLLRRHGVSTVQISALTGQSEREVVEVLKGRQITAFDVLARITRGLGVPRGYIGLAYDEAVAVNKATPPGAPRPPAQKSERDRRREFLAHAAAIIVGSAVVGTASGTWSSWSSSPPVPGRIGMTDVRQVEAAVRALRTLDHQYSRGSCRDAVIAQLAWARGMLNSVASPEVRQRLHIALADLHDLAGWTSFEAGLYHSAREHFGRSRGLVRRSREEGLIASVLEHMGGGRLLLAGDHAPETGLVRRRQGEHLGPQVTEAWRAAREAHGPGFSLGDLLLTETGSDFLR